MVKQELTTMGLTMYVNLLGNFSSGIFTHYIMGQMGNLSTRLQMRAFLMRLPGWVRGKSVNSEVVP